MTSEPGYLRRVERWTLVLAALVTLASLVAMPRAVAFAAAVGAAMMCANAIAIRALTDRVFRSRGGATPGIGVVLFNFKMAILIAMVWVALRYLHLDGVGFLLGISVFPVAIVAAALSARLQAAEDDDGVPNPNGPGGPHVPFTPTSGDR